MRVTLVLELESYFNVSLSRIGRKASDQRVMLKHLPRSRCILNSHSLNEKNQSSIIIYIERSRHFSSNEFFSSLILDIAGVLDLWFLVTKEQQYHDILTFFEGASHVKRK